MFFHSSKRNFNFRNLFFPLLFVSISMGSVLAQDGSPEIAEVNTEETFQTITGFGASLAYYENWLTAHPNRSKIYDIIFKELSLDILRVRNAYSYDSGMVGRVKQFANAAKNSLGHPIDILATSWGPAAYVKSNNDKNNGGTIKFSVVDGKVEFDYESFATWWNEALDEYNANGIYPKYIGIQNEPDWKASYESCLLKPRETVTGSDTIAGYNKALDAVYEVVTQRDSVPYFLGPECIGIGYNAVENYINALDLSKLYGIGHHLYHGAEGGSVTGDPFTSTNYKKVGNFHPEVPHFQTEYSRADWFSVAAMMYQTLVEESATAFLYWDLIWTDGGGLVDLDFPWDRSKWGNSNGFRRTKDFYVFKHYSAYIHPGWLRVGSSLNTSKLKSAAFLNTTKDSATFVLINRSETDSAKVKLHIPGYNIDMATAYTSSEEENFAETDYLADTVLAVPPKSISTISMLISPNTASRLIRNTGDDFIKVINYPNPFSQSTTIRFSLKNRDEINLTVFNSNGQLVRNRQIGNFPSGTSNFIFYRNGLNAGLYFFKLENSAGKIGLGKLMVKD